MCKSEGPPERIWLQWYGDDNDPDFEEPNQVMDEVTWHRDRVFEHDVEYVRVQVNTGREERGH